MIGLALGLTLGVLFCLFIEPIQDFLSAVVGFDVFPGTVYSLETLPARVEWAEVVMIVAVHDLRELLIDTGDGLVGLAFRSGGGAAL